MLSENLSIKKPVKFWNRLTFIKKHLKKFERNFGGSCVKIFDCRAFSLFETVPACRAFGYSLLKNFRKTAPLQEARRPGGSRFA